MKKTLIAILMGLSSACGIKGPPLPPLTDAASQKQVTVGTTETTQSASGDATSATTKPSSKKVKK